MTRSGSSGSRFRRHLKTAAWLGVGVLGLVAFVGLGALVQPFTWDQAVFALGAERLLAGGRLYVDYWDFKQPGIFWFFALAGRLFGVDEGGPPRSAERGGGKT